MKLHKSLFLGLIFFIPLQTRILYLAENSYVSWHFNYQLGVFLYLTDILIIGLFASWIGFDNPKINQIVKRRLFIYIAGFMVLLVVSLIHVKHIELSLYSLLKWIEILLLLIYTILNVDIRKDFPVISLLLFISGTFQSMLGWVQFHVQHMVGISWLGEYIAPLGTSGLATIDTAAGKIIRAYGTMPHPNLLAIFLVLALICGLYLVSRETFTKKQVARTLAITTGIIFIQVGLFATFSRLAWAAAATVLIGFIIFHLTKKQKNIAAIILVTAIVSCATIYIFYNDQLQARVNENNTVSISDRYFFNGLGFELIKKSPVLGVGVGNYVPAMQGMFALEPWQHQPAHNIFIFIAAELGLLGLALFVMILFEVYKPLLRIEWNILTFSIGLIAILFLFLSMFDHYFVTIQQGRLMFFVMLGLLFSLSNSKSPNDA